MVMWTLARLAWPGLAWPGLLGHSAICRESPSLCRRKIDIGAPGLAWPGLAWPDLAWARPPALWPRPQRHLRGKYVVLLL